MLKLAILTYSPFKFGIYYYAYNLSKELNNMNVDVKVFRTSCPIKNFGIPLTSIKYGLMNNLLKKFDIIQSNEGLGIGVNHNNLIETYHHDFRSHDELKYYLYSFLEDIMCKKAKRIIVPSYGTLNRLLSYGHSREKIEVIPHGVDHKFFKYSNDLRKKTRSKYNISNFTIITVGQLTKRKCHIDLINALSMLNKRVTLILIGYGPQEKNILSLARKYGMKILFFRHVPRHELVCLYNSSDIYVHTSILEGFCLTVLEALSCGLPVIAYETADFTELIGKAGFVLKSRDIVGLKNKIELLERNKKFMQRLSEEAIIQSRKFSWKESAKKHLKLYNELIC